MVVKSSNMVSSVVNNTTEDIVLNTKIDGVGIVWAAGESIGVFIRRNLVKNDCHVFTSMLSNGTASPYNSHGDLMENSTALEWFNYLLNVVLAKDFSDVSVQVEHNIKVGKWIVAIVREEMLVTGLSQFGLSGGYMAMKLQSIIMLLSVGMNAEAEAAMGSVERDGFLTDERVARYVGLLNQSDVITN